MVVELILKRRRAKAKSNARALTLTATSGSDHAGEATVDADSELMQDGREILTQELLNRLEAEARLWLGCRKLMMFLLFVSFQLWGLILSGASPSKMDVYAFLADHLDFESLEAVTSVPDLRDAIAGFSRATKDLYPLSDAYTSDPEQMSLVSGRKDFDQEVVYPPNTHPTIRLSFTFSVWVDRHDAAVIRKVVEKATGEEVVCWEWTVSSFRYGGHDGPADLPPPTVQAAFGKSKVGNGQLSLVNLVVIGNRTHAQASFYLNGDLKSSAELKSGGFARPVTDCMGGKMILGGHGMRFSLSDLKYFPRALKPIEIKEIFEKGQPLSEIVMASRSQTVTPSMKESLEQILEQKINAVMRKVDQKAGELSSLSIVDANAVPPLVQTQVGPDHVLADEVRWLDGVWDVQANGILITNGTVDFTKSITVSFWIRQGRNTKSVAFSLEGVHKQCFFVYLRGINNQIIIVINGMRSATVTGTDILSSSVNFDNDVWRHVAISVTVHQEGPGAYSNVNLLSSTVYLDGAQVATNPMGSFYERGASGDCSLGRSIRIGARADGAYRFSGSVRSIRVYNRSLSRAEVKSLSEAHRTCVFLQEVTDDMKYRSAYGYGCRWYSSMKKSSGVSHCSAAEYDRCPHACGGAAFCFEPVVSPFRVYSHVQLSDPVTDGEVFFTYPWRDDVGGIEWDSHFGRLCVDSSIAAATWEEDCKAWNVTQLDYQFDLHLRFGSAAEFPTPVTCRVSEACNFEALDYGTMFDIGKAFTVYWWSWGGGHLSALSSPRDFCFQQYGKYLYFRSGPRQSDAGYFSATSKPEFGRWIMKAVSSGPSSLTFCVDGECHTQSTSIHCPRGIHGLLVGSARTSPIMFSPSQMPPGQLQTIFYNEVDYYDNTVGPQATIAQMAATQEITIKHFPLKIHLAAPPLITQTRKAEKPCPSFTQDNSEKMFQEQAAAKCTPPYTCKKPDAWVPCLGDSDVESATWESWSLHSKFFRGQMVYPEFLYTLDNAILMRGGGQVRSADFVDSGTNTLNLIAIFSTPQLHATSVLTVAANLEGTVASMAINLQHVRSLQGAELVIHMVVSIFALFFGLGLMLLELKDLCAHRKGCSTHGASMSMMQLLFSALQVSFVGFRMSVAFQSKSAYEGSVGPLYHTPWLEPMDVWTKKDRLLTILHELLAFVDKSAAYDLISFFILCLLFIRMPLYQTLHIRLAGFPVTLGLVMEELFHFLLTSTIMFLLLAGLGHWSFGASDAPFSTFTGTLDMQLKMLTGAFPFSKGHESLTRWVYYFMYTSAFFFILVNFLLAIIVDSYVVYKDIARLQPQVQNFALDVALCCWQFLFKARWCGWPNMDDLINDLRKWGEDGHRELTGKEFITLPSITCCKPVGGTTFWKYYTETYNLAAKCDIAGVSASENGDMNPQLSARRTRISQQFSASTA